MTWILAISFGVAAVGLVACFVLDFVQMLRDPEKTNEFALTWLLFWLIDEE